MLPEYNSLLTQIKFTAMHKQFLTNDDGKTHLHTVQQPKPQVLHSTIKTSPSKQ